MSDRLNLRVIDTLDRGLNGGLNVFELNPSVFLHVLKDVIQKIELYNKRIEEVLDSGENGDSLLEEVFPENRMAFFALNSFIHDGHLSDRIIGYHAGKIVSSDDLKRLGFRELVRKKKSHILARRKISEYEFAGKVYKFDHTITYDDIYKIYENQGRQNELRLLGIEIYREYKHLFFIKKPKEVDPDFDEHLRYMFDLNYKIECASASLGFDLKTVATTRVDFSDPAEFLSGVYTTYSFMLRDLEEVGSLFDEYVDTYRNYESVGKSMYIGDIDKGTLDLNSFVFSWERFKEDLYNLFGVLDDEEKVRFMALYIDILEQDREALELVVKNKEFEVEVLKNNYLHKLFCIQKDVRERFRNIKKSWREDFGDPNIVDSLEMPIRVSIEERDFIEYEIESFEGLSELRLKYINLFFEEIDLREFYEFLNVNDVNEGNLRDRNLIELIYNFKFSNDFNQFKFEVFLNIIFNIVFGGGYYHFVNEMFRQNYIEYLNRPISFEECVCLEDYLKLWDVCGEGDRERIVEKVGQLAEGIDYFGLDKETRDQIREIVNYLPSDDLIYLTDFSLESSQIALNLREIEAFMKVLNAKKEVGSSSHLKYKIDLGEGESYSYTISTSVIKSGKYFAVKLLQDVAVCLNEPRVVSQVFVDRLKRAYSKIGMQLTSKVKD